MLTNQVHAQKVESETLTAKQLIELYNSGRRNFSGIILAPDRERRIEFRGVDLRGVVLSGVNVEGVDFFAADLRGANLGGVLNLDKARYVGYAIFYATYVTKKEKLIIEEAQREAAKCHFALVELVRKSVMDERTGQQ